MPILKGAASENTSFVKANAVARPAGTAAPRVVASTAPALVGKNAAVSAVVLASRVAAAVAPQTVVVSQATAKSSSKSNRS